MEKEIEEKEGKKYNKFQWFLVAFLIPVLFAVTVALIVSTVAGFNVFELAKEYGSKVPILSSIIPADETKSLEKLEDHMIELQGQIKDREAKISKLETDIDTKDKEVERVKLEKEQLQKQIDELVAIQEENKRAFKDIIKTYETISPKKSAPIITSMTDDEAIKILTNIKAETLAGIMENMPPEDAARFTELLTSESARGN
ncbi:MotE family protein [Cytobacillus spongiae]|uniref:MotE family protein n=1 Tax=Cytobacillus spongiae TaxID=2901381 RepID=UPI001F3B1193|nr:MotE family protein [Cytobacillus spongiae]UII57412.1 MotE family protein [Cytobacillus spongiae]